MRRLLVVLLGLLSSYASAQQLSDGPYVFYSNNKPVAKRLVNGALKVDTLNKKDPFLVEVPNHPEWSFKVKLKKSIDIEKPESAQPKKILFLSDIEGEFAALRLLLIGNKVIDSNYNWIYGKGQLVVCGDLFDRGEDVVPVLWLLYKLEEDAKTRGGYVHTILGNHDMMNLSGDYRYVRSKYLTIAKDLGLGYNQLYTPDTELGRWLLSKNIIEKIGDNLCLHGGVSPDINKSGLSLTEINTKFRPYYTNYGKTNEMTDQSLVSFLKNGTSLFWYRGYFSEPKATDNDVEETLKLFKVKRIIVGHTITKENIAFYYDRKVIGIDVNQHAGDHRGALYENDTWYKVDGQGNQTKL